MNVEEYNKMLDNRFHLRASASALGVALLLSMNGRTYGLVDLEVSWEREGGFTDIKPSYEMLEPF